MQIIDAQLHEPGIDSSWGDRDITTRRAVLTEALATLLAAVGVDGAVLHPVEDIEWAFSVAERAPDRFAVVPMLAGPDSPVRRWWDSRRWDSIDPHAPDLADRLDRAFGRVGFAGIRVFATAEMDLPPAAGSGHDIALGWCERRQVPVFVAGGDPGTTVTALVGAYPSLTLVLDQMGLSPALPDVWAGLPGLLAAAAHPTVCLKMTGLPAFSRPGPPERTIGRLAEIVEAFGARRCMWASDITQVQGRVGVGNRFPHEGGPDHFYAGSLAFVREATWLTAQDMQWVLGGTARRLLRWPVTQA